MDIRKVKKLIELLEESGIAEIEIHEGEESVRISRQGSGQLAQATYQLPPQATQQAAAEQPSTSSTATEPTPTVEEGNVISAPMVGTFYNSPSPDSPPFIEVGQKVSEGDIVCIIEAMKIMNQIECEVSGTISKILIENGEPVEYGQPMFVIKPDK